LIEDSITNERKSYGLLSCLQSSIVRCSLRKAVS